ncbi:MAG: hypothetical protein EHM47_08090 [Ignavibacteriales bacterium]|nr:MAG: hypothetical protein EHM47_08090 [Ignavibacteriales bacterium]
MFNLKAVKFLFVLLLTIPLSAQDTTSQEEREKIIEEYKQISSRLMELQKQALSDLNVSKQAENFSQNLEKAMVREDSTVLNKINRREEIISKFEEADKTGNQTEAYNLQQEFQEITEELMVHQKNILESDEELRKEGEALEDSLYEKMKDIDPEVPKLVARLETLNNQIQNLEGDKKL